VTFGAACAKLGIQNSNYLNEENEPLVKNGKIALGNMDSKRDWGFAGDYVEAMWLMLQQKNPDDFVIATGETHTIRELCRVAYGYVGLDYKKYVYTDLRFIRPTETGPLIGNSTKAAKTLGWQPKTSFKDLVEMMVDAHLAKLR
jgi:GDPmannose 4,6-dehydratase